MLFANHLRLSSKIWIAGAVIIPAALGLMAAWLDYRWTIERSREYVVVATNALAEQSNEALQTARLIVARTLDRIDGLDWPTIDKSRDVHDFLSKIVREMPLLQSVFLVDPDGYNAVSSRAFPMKAYDDRAREYYLAAKNGDHGLHVTALFLGQMTGMPGFTVSQPRLSNGRFDGVAVVTLSPAYFRSFYEKIALSPRSAAAALVRADGKLLARYPADDAVTVLAPDSPLLQATKSADTGVFWGRSTTTGKFELAAYRRIDNQPLLATFSVAQSYYLHQWYVHLVGIASFALLTALALLWTSSVALRQAAIEEMHLRRLLAESERRKEAEEALQHLQKMEALGRLSGGVAHDFNNLLAAIIGALELAKTRINDPARLGRLLETAMQAAERGARLTAQMLSFSRNQDISLQPLDINAVIRETDGLIQRTVEALVEVSYSLDEGLWPAIGDRVQFEVALLNLAGNARDAMPLGGKLLLVTRNVWLSASEAAGVAAGDYVQISVSDTGEGMTEETRARAFDPFFTTKGVGKGTGLGLSQVYGFADQVGGAVRIQSSVGQGTTVTIWLPRAEPATAAPEAPEPAMSELAPAAPLNILLVDDDRSVRVLTHEMLAELGHSVCAAENGPAAITQLSSGAEFDLLLADFAMPGMNGAQVADQAIQLRPKLFVLFMTGYADTDVLGSWIEAGYRTLKKPFGAAELDFAIRQTVRSQPPSCNVVALTRARN